MNRIVYYTASESVFLEIIFHLGQYGPVSSLCLDQLVKIMSPEKGEILGGIFTAERKICDFGKKFTDAFLCISVKLTVYHYASESFFVQEGMGVFYSDSGLKRPSPVSDDRLGKIPQADRVALPRDDRRFRHNAIAGKLA